jgi:hypothetical protein
MKPHLYLSFIPEGLIASQLSPEDFGNYLAVGTKKRTRGQAIFIEVDPDLKSDYFPLKHVEERCVAHPTGQPKSSVYLSIYRVLENLPIAALGSLFLTTDDGRVLELKRQKYEEESKKIELHLYQEFLPVNPRIASNLNPRAFCKFVTDTSHPVSVPRLAFAEMILNGLSSDPIKAQAEDLPYPNIDHLRDCLVGLQENPSRPTKTVIRCWKGDVLYRTIKNGFFVGDQKDLIYYHFPEKDELENKYFTWWRSALTVHFGY